MSWTESSSRASLALVFGALLAVGVATLGGLSKGEVERIWLPFALWTMVACSAIPRPRAQTWLIAQAVTALLLQHLLVAPW
jgi:hypothetical protein